MGLFGPPNVEKMKANGDVSGLIKALTYAKDSKLRSQAAQALGEIKDPQALDALIHAVGYDRYTPNSKAVWALGEIVGDRVVKELVNLASTSSVEKIATTALIRIGPHAVAAALTVQNAYQRKQIFKAFQSIDWRPGMDEAGAAYYLDGYVIERNWDAAVLIGAPAVGPIIAILRDRSEKAPVRNQAVVALGRIGDPRAVLP